MFIAIGDILCQQLSGGQSCTESMQCSSGLCVLGESHSGRCASDAPDGTVEAGGNCASHASCVEGLVCGHSYDQYDVESVCCDVLVSNSLCGNKTVGIECSEDVQCQSFYCEGRVCMNPRDLKEGWRCQNNSQCNSGICEYGVLSSQHVCKNESMLALYVA